MKQAVLYGPYDVRIEEHQKPGIIEEPTDAIIRLAATSICATDLWPYRIDHTPSLVISDGSQADGRRALSPRQIYKLVCWAYG
ncbi:MAG: hypothetical protein C4289_17555 [Chloroflexota bacterium]